MPHVNADICIDFSQNHDFMIFLFIFYKDSSGNNVANIIQLHWLPYTV